MSTSVISPVVPAVPSLSGGQVTAVDSAVFPLVRRPLPLPSLISRRTSSLVYGLAAVDSRGRVADRVVMRALGWHARQRLAITETDGILTVHTEPHGNHEITGQGHLRLPATLRHRCGLTAGNRVLLAADPDQCRLTIYPPAALDNALSQPGGDPQ